VAKQDEFFADAVVLLIDPDKGSHQRLPRESIHGFDAYLKKPLGANLYLELNEESKDFLGVIDSDDDALIWKRFIKTRNTECSASAF
jgi:hypothetical protein